MGGLRHLIIILLLLGSSQQALARNESLEYALERCFTALAALKLPQGWIRHIKVPENPVDIQTLSGPVNQELPANNLSMTVWNIQKGKNSQWGKDLETISRDSDLVLLQEASLRADIRYPLVKSPHSWVFATSFMSRKHPGTGVTTGSKAEPVEISYARTVAVEPLIKTPKMALATKFKIQGREEQLLVVNVHAINFVGSKEYNLQLAQIFQLVQSHSGPVIVAGDFNTWNSFRWNELRRLFDSGAAGMRQVPLNRYNLFFHLDYVFARGIKVETAEQLGHVKSSDHFPIRVEFSIL
ncbi:MAG: endonuclease/exonuclease/phosphatase family protein [Oligoflexia bacterium]|nr:endonuclease/exonuclease/phosphatase family protein [Oligoflexia bacterium]